MLSAPWWTAGRDAPLRSARLRARAHPGPAALLGAGGPAARGRRRRRAVGGDGGRGRRCGGDPAVLGRGPVGTDVVLAGDVCYDREMTERVLPFLDRARARGCEVYVGDPGRPYLPHDRLEPVAAYDIPETEGPGLRRTTVWRLP